MKKLFSLLLACMMLFLTSCNQTPPNGTTPGNSQAQGTPNDSELKDTIIRNGHSEFMDLPSRIVFQVNHGTAYYYSKADGKAYVYCFDPLCDHSGGKCFANPKDLENVFEFELRCTFFINNRFYVVTTYGQIYSMAFDGSDIRIEYGEEEYVYGEFNYYLWSQNYRAYDKYIYIPTELDENEKYNLLRFNTETKEMENLSEKTGNFMNPAFFYNGEIYGRGERYRGWYKADLDMKTMEPIEEPQLSNQFYGSVFFDSAYDDYYDYENRQIIGIQAYDMKTGETMVFTNEMLGLEANMYKIIATDENYIYFYQFKTMSLGTYIYKGQEKTRIKYDEGKLYRLKHDGTECVCIYDNPYFDFLNLSRAVIYENKIILQGAEYTLGADGHVVCTSSGMQVGTMGEDGKIDKFEPIEFVY